MANFKLPNGAQLSIASGLLTTQSITAFTNANPGVMTLNASHGISTSDLFVVSNSWSKTNGRIFKAASVATNDVTVSGLDTSSTANYPAGSGVGSIQEISGWTQIVGVLTFQSEGGDQQYATVQALEDDAQTRLPTTKSARGLNISVGDDTSLAWYALAKAASDGGNAIPLKLTLKNGNLILYNGILTLDETPTLNVNEVMSLRMTMSLSGQPTRY
jgi:hypothetical protein